MGCFKLFTIGLILVLVLSLGGCGSQEDESGLSLSPDIRSTQAPDVEVSSPGAGAASEEPVAPSSSEAVKPVDATGKLTVEQALSDYDYMWSVLERNYPTFNVSRRMYGTDKDKIKENARHAILEYSERMNLRIFYSVLKNMFKSLSGNFHLDIIDPEFYYAHITGQREAYYTQFITDWEKPEEAYGYLADSSIGSISRSAEAQSTVENEEFKLLDQNTAYLFIKSFINPSEEDLERLIGYYKQAEGCDNFIIDISRNSGGSDWYWMAGIVAPNITDEVNCNHSFLAKSGKENRQYLESRNFQLHEDMSAVDTLININHEDRRELDLCISLKKGVKPRNSEKAFKGRIYVLIDEPVYSSAESFTMFCKKTGFATLVGRNSGGDGGGADPLVIPLPESGLLFRYSTLYSLNDDGSCNEEFGTTPDYMAESYETPLEACLRIINNTKGK